MVKSKSSCMWGSVQGNGGEGRGRQTETDGDRRGKITGGAGKEKGREGKEVRGEG